LELPSLTSINGGFVLSSTALASFDAPNLKTIGGLFLVTGVGPNVTFEISNLQNINMGLSVIENAFTWFNLHSLKTVNGDVTFSTNPNLEFLNLDSLSTVEGSVVFAENPTVIGINLPSLTDVEDRFIIYNDSFGVFAPALSFVGGDFILNAPIVGFNASGLQYVNGSIDIFGITGDVLFNSLYYVGGDFIVANTVITTKIETPVLFTIQGQYYIYNNVFLNTIFAPLLDTIGGAVNIDGAYWFKVVDFASLRSVCAYNLGETNNFLQADPVYYFCPQLLNIGYCSSFTAKNINSTCSSSLIS